MTIAVKATNKFGLTTERQFVVYTQKDTPPTFGAFKEVCALTNRTPALMGSFIEYKLVEL